MEIKPTTASNIFAYTYIYQNHRIKNAYKIIKENYAKIVITEIYLYTGAEALLRETQE